MSAVAKAHWSHRWVTPGGRRDHRAVVDVVVEVELLKFSTTKLQGPQMQMSYSTNSGIAPVLYMVPVNLTNKLN